MTLKEKRNLRSEEDKKRSEEHRKLMEQTKQLHEIYWTAKMVLENEKDLTNEEIKKIENALSVLKEI